MKLPIRKDPEAVEKSVENAKQTLRAVLPVLGIVILIVGAASVLEWYADWRAWHQWQNPVVFRSAIVEIEKPLEVGEFRMAEVVEVKPTTEILEQYRLSPVLKSIYFLESTSGKNDGCKDEGKYNGFGYAQNNSVWRCYDSLKDVSDRVNEWFEDRLLENGNNLMEAACYYNTGKPNQLTCEYGQNFVSVLADQF